jgi:hypothetical protein
MSVNLTVVSDRSPQSLPVESAPTPPAILKAHELMKGIGKPEQDVRLKPDFPTGRAPHDRRTAEQIIKDNPILANLGTQKDINRDQAYARLGDWTSNNPDPDARADAAFNAARVLNYIDTSLSASGLHRGQADGNGHLEGITSAGDARRGTPAGMWKDFTEQGYTALRDDHRLDATDDTHVRLDGSIKGDAQWLASEAGRKLWFIPGLSNILQGAGNAGKYESAFAGAQAGLAKTRQDGFDRALASAATMDIKGAVQGYIDTMRNNEATPPSVKSALDEVSHWLAEGSVPAIPSEPAEKSKTAPTET